MGELKVVEDMHARKTLMTQLADAFIALPGKKRKGKTKKSSEPTCVLCYNLHDHGRA
jgi:hypothetical protein